MIERIELQWLRTFHAVYQCSSFKKASEQLDLPTSNVSRHVVLLEENLGTRLLERTTRRISPTESGHQLYSSTFSLLMEMNEALEDVSTQTRTIAGQVKIILPDLPMLADAVVTFCSKHPNINICCETSLSPTEGFLDGYDLVLSFNRGNLADCGWVAKEIAHWPSVVVASPSLIKRFGRPYKLDEIKELPCITSLTALNGTPWIFKGKDSEQVTLGVFSSFKVNSGNMAKSAAISGLGYAILAKEACSEELASGQLDQIDLEQKPENLVLYAFYAYKKYLPIKTRAFLEHLHSSVSVM